MLEHAPLPLYEASIWDSAGAIIARAPWRRRLIASARDIFILALALRALIFIGARSDGTRTSLLLAIAMATIFICTAPPVSRRRWMAGAARVTRDFLLSLAHPARMTTSGFGCDWASLTISYSMHSSTTLAVANTVTRRVAARLLARLGAVTAPAQPRLATSLVAGSPRFARG